MIEKFDIQGHRGWRGLYPENTIEGFLATAKLGVHTLEMDVTLSKDHQVIVSHDPYFSHEFCLLPNGDEIFKEDEQNHKTFELTHEEIKTYDTGTKFHEKFPEQKKIKTYKPRLAEVVQNVNQFLSETELEPPHYNIEIKRKIKWDHIFHPEYKIFSDLVVAEIKNLGIEELTTVQCFDIETLQYLKEKYPEFKLVYLIENEYSFEKSLGLLGFIPEVYSPYFKLVNPGMVKACHQKNMKLIPWTVNENEDMLELIQMGVDGIISDYPDRLIQLLK